MKTTLTLLFALSALMGFGQVTFQKTYGGDSSDFAYSVQQTTDGGYIITGVTLSFNAQEADVYLIKLTANGTITWSRRIAHSDEEHGSCVQQTADGGYIIAGATD